MAYTPVIGLEIHVQAKTKSKMFCRCSAEYFGAEPNTHVCPVCLGLPGALPVPNKASIEHSLRLSLALNCEINQFTKFDRKNYFYPDLPKGYQISQYDLPIGHDGFVEIDVDGDSRRIRIRRIHQEEDTGKSSHEEGEAEASGETLLDYNKSGVPLIEIVTEPDFEEVKEVLVFCRLLKQTVQYLGVSDAEMQKGQMRFELNMSLRNDEEKGLPDYKVEVKNIGSISVLEKVIQFEFERQSALLMKGEKPANETRGLRDLSGTTYSQRTKETEGDYRYFPEPDIPPIIISDEQFSAAKAALPELPAERKQRYMDKWGLEGEQAEILVEYSDKGDWMDQLIEKSGNPEVVKAAVKWFTGEISGLMEKNGVELKDLPVSIDDLLYLVDMIQTNKISGTIAKKVIEELFSKGGNAAEIIQANGYEQVNDTGKIAELVKQVIDENPNIVADLAKNPNALKSLVGKTMGLSKGQANPQMVDAEMRKQLGM